MIEATTGPEVEVYTKEALAARESAYLMRVAPLGLLFGAGMAAEVRAPLSASPTRSGCW